MRTPLLFPSLLSLLFVPFPDVRSSDSANSMSACGAPRDAKSPVMTVWDAAKAALAATQATAGSQEIMANVSRFDRTVSRDGKVLASQPLREGAVPARHPYITLMPEVVAKTGYVVDDSSQVEYYAPDADILLSAQFADSHCFDMQSPPSAHKEWVGLSFRPRDDRTGVKDIAGTFWLDRATSELRQVDFRYTQVPPAYQAANVGGNLWFAHLPSGLWLLKRWEIRMPQGQVQSRIMLQHSQARDQLQVTIESLRVAGGDVTSVTVGSEVIRLTPP